VGFQVCCWGEDGGGSTTTDGSFLFFDEGVLLVMWIKIDYFDILCFYYRLFLGCSFTGLSPLWVVVWALGFFVG
jgi:hypothetical protein